MVKTITITNEAYELLKKMKGTDDSFSKAIIKFTSERKIDLNRFLGILSEKEVEKSRKRIKNTRKMLSKDFGKRANVPA